MGGTYGSLPEVTWSGHSFDGWFTAATNGTRVLPGSEVTADATRTLYAHWTPEGGGTVLQFSFGMEGGTQTLVLSGGRSTSQSNPLAWVDSGLQVALSGGSYVTTLTVSCAANNGSKRMGDLTVTVDGTTYMVTVVQDGDFGVSEFATEAEAGLCRITWVGEAGRRYAVQRAPSPDGPWSAAGTIIASGDGLVSLEAAMPGQWSQGFYRLTMAE